ncbi:hypothetical protein AKJ16_DCAP17866 [Drosera capensis]
MVYALQRFTVYLWKEVLFMVSSVSTYRGWMMRGVPEHSRESGSLDFIGLESSLPLKLLSQLGKSSIRFAHWCSSRFSFVLEVIRSLLSHCLLL